MLKWTFVVVLVFYLPIMIAGYGVFGSSTLSPIVDNLKKGWATQSVIVCIAINLFVSYMVIMNPSEKAFESQCAKYIFKSQKHEK